MIDDQREKPVVRGPLDGNVFSVFGAARRTLARAGRHEEAARLMKQLPACKSYDQAIALAMEYVEFEL